MSPWLKAPWQLILEALQSGSPPHAWCLAHAPADLEAFDIGHICVPWV